MASNNEKDDPNSILNNLTEDDLEDDYYLVLNIPKDASDKEITQAYHRLGLIYHPDKHKDVESKRNAELLFSKIKKVYDVLINPHKRAIYDSLGAKGLLQENMQLVIRSKTPREIREEYERLSKEREEKRLEKLTYSQGHFSMQVDATRIFDSVVDQSAAKSFQDRDNSLVRVGNFDMMQSIEFPISNKDTVTLDGKIGTERAFGSGNCSLGLRHILSADTYIDTFLSLKKKFKGNLGAKKGFNVLAFKRLTQALQGEFKAIFRYKKGNFTPLFLQTLNYQLDTNLIGQLQFRTDAGLVNTAMSTGLIYEKDNLSINTRLELAAKNSFVSFSIGRAFMNNDIKLKSSIQYGYFGATLSYGIEKQVTKFSRVNTSIMINSMAGVILNLEFQRGLQNFTMPIQLSNEIVPSAIFYGTVTPLIFYYVAKKLVIDPYVKSKEAEEAKKKQDSLKTELIEKKRLALASQNLMKEAVDRILEREGENGLIIKKAIYGKIEEEDKTRKLNFDGAKIIDVLIPVQFLVKDHSLQIFSDQSKSSLEGFYDPCFGETKSLYIEYKFNGDSCKATFEDCDFVRLPKATHKVQWWSRPFNSVKT